MNEDSFSIRRLGPLGQMRACANLMDMLRDCARDEAVLRANNARLGRDWCVDVLAELDLVIGQLDPDLGRDLALGRERFADTPTTVGRCCPNPAIGRNLRMLQSLLALIIEALSVTMMDRRPQELAMGHRLLERLRA